MDDTGSVANGEQFIVAIIYVKPSSLPALTLAFERWKKLSRRKILSRPAEVKSTDLTDEMYKNFVNQVLFVPGVKLNYFGFGISVDERVLEWGALQRDRYVKQYEAAIKEAVADGRNKWAKRATTLAGWLRRTPPSFLIKMEVLNQAIPRALNHAIIESTLGGFDSELGDLRYHIDLGFIKDRGIDNWREILRSNFAQYSMREPIVHITEWPNDHPFLKTFVQEGRGNLAKMTKEFRHRLDFYDSSTSIEVQIADIMAGLLRKKYIEKWKRPYIKRLKDLVPRGAKQHDLTVIILGPLESFEHESQLPNIYEEFDSRPSDGTETGNKA